MDKENTPPPERRGPRAITPPADNERRLNMPEDVISKKSFVREIHSLLESSRMKLLLANQVMQTIKPTSNQVMQKLFEKGKHQLSFLHLRVCSSHYPIVLLFQCNCMSFYSDEEDLGVENLVSVVQDLLIAKTDDDDQ